MSLTRKQMQEKLGLNNEEMKIVEKGLKRKNKYPSGFWFGVSLGFGIRCIQMHMTMERLSMRPMMTVIPCLVGGLFFMYLDKWRRNGLEVVLENEEKRNVDSYYLSLNRIKAGNEFNDPHLKHLTLSDITR